MRFERVFGPGGERPESYWMPLLGFHYGLRPCDIADMTPEQLWRAFDEAPKEA